MEKKLIDSYSLKMEIAKHICDTQKDLSGKDQHIVITAMQEVIKMIDEAPAVEAVEITEVIAMLRSLIYEYTQVNEYKPEIEGIRVTWTDDDNLTSRRVTWVDNDNLTSR